MNVNKPSVTSAGLMSGRIIFLYFLNQLHPSTSAASSNSSGMDTINERSINTPYVLISTPGSMSGINELVQPTFANIMNSGSIVTCPGIINVAINSPNIGLDPRKRIFAKANAAIDDVKSVPSVERAAIKNELKYARHSNPSPYAKTAL